MAKVVVPEDKRKELKSKYNLPDEALDDLLSSLVVQGEDGRGKEPEEVAPAEAPSLFSPYDQLLKGFPQFQTLNARQLFEQITVFELLDLLRQRIRRYAGGEDDGYSRIVKAISRSPEFQWLRRKMEEEAQRDSPLAKELAALREELRGMKESPREGGPSDRMMELFSKLEDRVLSLEKKLEELLDRGRTDELKALADEVSSVKQELAKARLQGGVDFDTMATMMDKLLSLSERVAGVVGLDKDTRKLLIEKRYEAAKAKRIESALVSLADAIKEAVREVRGSPGPQKTRPCPKCGMLLDVSGVPVGATLECPGCKSRFQLQAEV